MHILRSLAQTLPPEASTQWRVPGNDMLPRSDERGNVKDFGQGADYLHYVEPWPVLVEAIEQQALLHRGHLIADFDV